MQIHFVLLQNDNNKLCLICHEDIRKSGGGVQELLCTHRFHKEVNIFSDPLHVASTPCFHSFVNGPSLIYYNSSMSDIRSLVHESSSFLDLHDVKWYENNVLTPEIYLCGSMQHSNILWSLDWTLTDYNVSIWWVLKAASRIEQGRPRSSSEAAACQVRRFSDARRKSADGPISMEKEQHTPRRQLSLRRHRWYRSVEGGDSFCEEETEDLQPQVRLQGFLLNFRYYMVWHVSFKFFKSWDLGCAWPDGLTLSWPFPHVISGVRSQINTF